MGGSLEINEIRDAQQYSDKYKGVQNFVETGTYKGDTCISLSKYFEHIYTMEIVPSLYSESKLRARVRGCKNIQFFLGDSVQLLKTIVPQVKNGAVFFLDAHKSDTGTSHNGKRVPMLDELDVILEEKLDCSIFIFDDTRFWEEHDKHAFDWVGISISNILDSFEQHGYKVDNAYEKNDRFFVLAHYI